MPSAKKSPALRKKILNNTMTAKIKPSTRRKARRLVVQALYQQHYTADSVETVAAQHLAECNPASVDTGYFKDLFCGVVRHQPQLDELMQAYLDRSLDEVDPIERAILRMSLYELQERFDVPYKVVINEAIELAKIFGAEDGYKYINGVLDKAVVKLRPLELGSS